MPDKITTLKLVDNTDVFPNTKEENIPDTIMRIADLSKYVNSLTSININGDIDSTTITSDVATFTTADIGTLNVSGISQFEGKAVFGSDVEVDGGMTLNSPSDLHFKTGDTDYTDFNSFKTAILRDYMKQRYGGHILYGDDSGNVILSSLYPSVVSLGECTDWSGCFEASQFQGRYETAFKGDVKFSLPSVYANKEVNLTDAFAHWSVRAATIEEAQHTMTFTSDMTVYCQTAFWDSNLLTKVDVADNANVKVTNAQLMFYNCYNLVEVGAFDLSGITTASGLVGIFGECHALKTIHCKHFKYSFSINASTAFETADLVEIISNLDPVTTPQTLTMGATNLAKLTQEQILVGTGKGWTIA